MRNRDQTEGFGGLLHALAMPFQLSSLLFIALTSVLLALVVSTNSPLAFLGIFLLLVWLTHYALQLIDDVANGERETQVASAEMTSVIGDTRALVHPLLAVTVAVALYSNPQWPRWPVLAAAALLFPASLGACAISGRMIDAFHPGAMARVMRGLGPWYLPVVLFVLGCALLGAGLFRWITWPLPAIVLAEMLVLLVYACIGGALFVRRHELDFEPRVSPERVDEQQRTQRLAARQRFIDGVYSNLRVRESAQAIANATQWLQQTDAGQLPDDVHALLEAGTHWNAPREYPRLLRALVPVLLGMQQPALALQVAEAGLHVWPAFTPESEADATALIAHALHTGRRREAARLLDNYLQRAGDAASPGDALQALRARLQGTMR